MASHHIATITLIFYSYIGGWLHIGGLILWLHQWADIPVSLCRGLIDISPLGRNLTYVAMVLAWFYTRIWVFP